MRFSLIITLLLSCAVIVSAREPEPSGYFDPERHMSVADVREGMTGYGLSVFEGTEIEKFDVQVIAVLPRFNVKGDVILIRCSGQNLEHTGPISGMSGSPIYLFDQDGKAKLVGAFAYGWQLMKDPIAGVQPIEYMLNIREAAEAVPAGPASDIDEGAASGALDIAGPRQWVMDASYWNGWNAPPATHPLLAALGLDAASDASPADPTRLKPLATPLMTSGLPRGVSAVFNPALASAGFVSLQAGGAGAAKGDDGEAIQFEPGSVLAIPLLTGDVDMTAIGTVTEVTEGRVFGFGHPFNSAGPAELPMGNGRIHAIIPSMLTSFKLGAMAEVRGTITHDETFGVAGRIGDAPRMIPIDLRVIYPDLNEDRTYHFESVVHPDYTPLLSSMALMSAVTGLRELPPNHTIDYDLLLEFEDGHEVRLKNTVSDTYSGAFFFQVGMPMAIASSNPFKEVMVNRVTGEVRIDPHSSAAEILSVILPRTRYQPGETVKAFVLHRPFRGPQTIFPIEMQLPRELADGEYQLSVSDWQQYLNEEEMAKPFRFVAENVDEVFEVLSDVMGVQQKALYLRLLRESDGVAIGRTAMPHLPSSRRQIMLSAGRSNTTPFVSSTVKIIPTEYVMSGAAQFAITVERDAKVQSPAPTARGAAANSPDAQPEAAEDNNAPAQPENEAEPVNPQRPETAPEPSPDPAPVP